VTLPAPRKLIRGALSFAPIKLLPVIALAGILRIYELPARGLIYWDEAKFALEGERVHAALQVLVGAQASLTAGKAVGTAKPTHALLIALSYAVVGVHDYAPLLMSALCSIVGVALTYVIARQLFGPVVGLVSSIFLAVSEYDAIYARSALSESDAAALFLSAVAVCLWQRRRAASVCKSTLPLIPGVLLGASFTTNYRIAVYIAALVGLDLILRVREDDPKQTLLAAAMWIAGFLMFPGMWQGIDLLTHARGLALFRSEQTGAWIPYFQQAWYQLHEGKQSVLNFQPLPYLQWFSLRQGLPMSALTLAGLVLTGLRRTRGWIWPAWLVVAPYAAFVFAPFYVPRNLLAAIPFACILSAAALSSIVQTAQKHRAIVIATATLILVALGVWMSWRLTLVRSGFARAATYLEARHARAVTSSEVMVFYFPGNSNCAAPALPQTIGAVPLYAQAGYRFAVIERHHESPVVTYIRSHAPVAVRYPAIGNLDIGESLIASENSKTPSQDSKPEWVTVYRIDMLTAGLRASGRLLPCDRDRPT
jgi:4-amino-4-deoxy-L-arabinose transferase-like glycosyltransferase